MLLPPQTEQDLRRLLAGDFFGAVGIQLSLLALPTLAVLSLGATAAQASLLTALQWLPAVLLSGTLGRAADARNRKTIMVVASAVGGVLPFLLIASVWLPAIYSLWLVMAIAFALSAADVAYSLALIAVLPTSLTSISVSDAIALQSGVRNTARVVGQALAAPLVQLFGGLLVLIVNGCLSIVKCLCLSTIDSKQEESRTSAASKDDKSGWQIIGKHRSLLVVVFANQAMTVGGALVFGLFFVYAYDNLKLSPFEVGLMLFLGGAASIATAKAAPRVMNRLGNLRLVVWSGIAAASLPWLIPAANNKFPLATLIIYEVLFSIAATLFAISFSVVRQREVPNDVLGRVASISTSLNATGMVVGALMASILTNLIALTAALMVGCAISSLGSLPLLLAKSPARETAT